MLLPDGTPAYTRAGALSLNSDGLLANAAGLPLAARVAFPRRGQPAHHAEWPGHRGCGGSEGRRDRQHRDRGFRESRGSANPWATTCIGLPRPAARCSSARRRETGNGALRQGFLESSNVQLVDELVSLMLAQRGFEMNSKIVQAADQMLGITNSLYRG